jgi:hypothetical protein
MSDDLDKAIDRLTMPQRMLLGHALSIAMSVDCAKRAVRAKPGEVAFSGPFTLGDRSESAEAGKRLADAWNRRAVVAGEPVPQGEG